MFLNEGYTRKLNHLSYMILIKLSDIDKHTAAD